MIRRLLREPLLQFLLIGLGLFGGYRLLNPTPDRREQPARIELTTDDLRQIRIAQLQLNHRIDESKSACPIKESADGDWIINRPH